MAAILPPSIYDLLVVADGATLYWPMNETSASQTDVVAGQVLTLGGGVIEMAPMGLNFGDLFPAVILRAGADLVCTPTAPAAIVAPFTLECWSQSNGGAVAIIVSTRTPNDFGTQLGFGANGEIQWTIGNGLAFLALGPLANPVCGAFSRHHYLALVAAPGAYHLYLDGKEVATGGLAGGGILYNATHIVRIGSYNGLANFLNSSVSRVAMYNTALSAAKIAAHFLTGVYGTIPTSGSFGGPPSAVMGASIDEILRCVRKVY